MIFSHFSRYYGTDSVMDARSKNGTAFDERSKFESVTRSTRSQGKEDIVVRKITSTSQHEEIENNIIERSVVDVQERSDVHPESKPEDELEEIVDSPVACTVLEPAIDFTPINTLIIQISSSDSKESVLDIEGFPTGEETEASTLDEESTTGTDYFSESFSTNAKNQKELSEVGILSLLLGGDDDASAPSDNSSGESEYNEIGKALCCSDEEARERSIVKPLRYYDSRVLADFGTFDFSETDGTTSMSDEDCISTT